MASLEDPMPDVRAVRSTDLPGEVIDAGQGRIFPCEACGADLKFDIGAQSLKCPYCGFTKEIELDESAEIREQDFHAAMQRMVELREQQAPPTDANELTCASCGGTVVFVGTLTSTHCPYCASPLQLEKVHKAEHRIPVDAVLTFRIDERKARSQVTAWVRSLWFAPNDFVKQGVQGKLNGVYLPYWTFDCLTFNKYSGRRGDDYWVTVGSGKNRRRQRRTRWWPASGQFQRFFDDVLVVASSGLPSGHILNLEPWPLGDCMPFTQEALAGHLARTYDVELDAGFADGKRRIDAAIHAETRRRIGGDRQQVHSIKSRYDAITYKHLLLPVWLMAYRYHGKVFNLFINAATGEVQGERPYSAWKIFFAVVAAVVAAGFGFLASR